MKQECYTTMDYNEFEELVKKHLGITYEFPADEELMNDVDVTYTLTSADLEVNEYNDKAIQEMVEGAHSSFMAQTFMEKLCQIGVLPVGKYLISVSW